MPLSADGGVALARCVGDAEAFLTERFGRGPHRWFEPAGFDDLLSLADVDGIVAGRGPRPPALRLVRDGEVVPASAWTRPARTGASGYEVADPGKVLDLVAGGATLVLQGLHRWWPPLGRFCRDLQLALTHPVQANAYLTPAGATGLAPHHDTHDVFVLQATGTKAWQVREPAVVDPLARHRSVLGEAAARPVLFDAELKPGDAMYLPRGYVHSATAQEELSLHLTIGVLTVTEHAALVALVEEAGDDPAFRATLPAGALRDDESAAAAVDGVRGRLAAWLLAADPADLAPRLRRRLLARARPSLDGQLLQLARLRDLSDRSVVRRRQGAEWAVTTDGDRMTVELGDRSLELPSAVGPAVERLVTGGPLEVAELGDLLDGSSRLVLVRRLVREGLLEVVDG